VPVVAESGSGMSSAPGMSAAHGHVVVDHSMSSGAAELGQWDFHLAVAPVRFAGCSAARVRHEAREASGFTQAGWHASCLPWLHEREVALIGADAPQDVQPSGSSAGLASSPRRWSTRS
jgi:hypothetical protein